MMQNTRYQITLTAALLLSGGLLHGQATLLLDFGDNATDPGGNPGDPTWNTLSTATDQNTFSFSGFDWSDGTAATGIGVEGSIGANNSTPDDGQWRSSGVDDDNNWNGGADKDWVDSYAAGDYYWSTSTNATGGTATWTITLTGLDDTLLYDFELVSARSSTGSRVGNYEVQGTTTSNEVNSILFDSKGDGWDNESILKWSNISPTASGEIDLSMSASGGNQIFVNAIELTQVPEPAHFAGVAGLLALGLTFASRKRRQRKQ